jgi:hypothetical protein
MLDKIRCKCGAEFNPKDLSGDLRTACPICRTPLATASTISSPPPPTSASYSTALPAKPVAPVPLVATQAAATTTSPHLLAASASWMPPAGIRNHAGHPLGGSKYFPWGPPTAIGEVLFADSNVPGSGPPSLLVPCITAFGIWIATYLIFGEGLPIVIQGKVRCLAFCGQSNSLFSKEKEGPSDGSNTAQKDQVTALLL